jgi:hypothetical protein
VIRRLISTYWKSTDVGNSVIDPFEDYCVFNDDSGITVLEHDLPDPKITVSITVVLMMAVPILDVFVKMLPI